MKLNKVILAAAVVMLSSATVMAQELSKNMRSSIYTILVNSDEQNTRLDKEAKDVDAAGYAEAVKGLKGGLGAIPKAVFPTIEIPTQFNDHNLATRVLDFDKITTGMTEEQAKAAKPKESAGSKLGGFAKKAGADAMGGNSSILRVEKVDDYMHAAVQKFLNDENIAAQLVAKWYNYKKDGKPGFNDNLIAERGFENASAAEIEKAKTDALLKAQLSAQGFDLIDNTFLIATNLRFRNNKAVAKEIADLAAATAAAAGSKLGGGAIGGLAAMGAKAGTEALVNKLMKDQYSVTAVSHLYKLEWNPDIDQAVGDVVYKEGTTLQDLINLGVCKLTYVNQNKARAGVKKDKTKSLSELAASASRRAIDKSIAKLQVDNEVFRTRVPISKSEDGFIYAKIGTKEGVSAGDEYSICEVKYNEKTGKNELKEIGKATVEKNQVWNNEIEESEVNAFADNDKDAQALKDAIALGATKFKASKKGDLSGYVLRLKKKKGKIED